MGWQDYIVWGIVLVAVLAVVRRLFGRRRDRCSSCPEEGCPLKNREKQ